MHFKVILVQKSALFVAIKGTETTLTPEEGCC